MQKAIFRGGSSHKTRRIQTTLTGGDLELLVLDILYIVCPGRPRYRMYCWVTRATGTYLKKTVLTGMSGPSDTSEPSSPVGTGTCHLADVAYRMCNYLNH